MVGTADIGKELTTIQDTGKVLPQKNLQGLPQELTQDHTLEITQEHTEGLTQELTVVQLIKIM